MFQPLKKCEYGERISMGLVVSRKIMQPLSVELTDVNRRS